MPRIEQGIVVETGLQDVLPLRQAVPVFIVFRGKPIPEEFMKFGKNLIQKLLVLRFFVEFPCQAGKERGGEIAPTLARDPGLAVNKTSFVLDGKEIFQQVSGGI